MSEMPEDTMITIIVLSCVFGPCLLGYIFFWLVGPCYAVKKKKIYSTARAGTAVEGAPVDGTDPSAKAYAGETHVSTDLKAGEDVVAYPYDDCRTLRQAFQRGVKLNPQGACLGTRPIDAAGKAGDYVFETYAVVDKRVTDVSTGLILANLVPPALKLESGDRRVMGIFVKDMAEWVITEQACNRINAVVLPMYDTYTVENVTDVTAQVGLKTILTTADKLDRCIEVCKAVPEMDSVVVVVNKMRRDPDVTTEQRAAAAAAGLTIHMFSDIEAQGGAALDGPTPEVAPAADDVATFCYTSGTTGAPKAAMLTHGAVVADLAGAIRAGLTLDKNDVHLAYLPAPHMFERMVEAAMLSHGGRIGFYQGETPKLKFDLIALRPTIFPSVPRLFTRFEGLLREGIKAKGGLAACLFASGYKAKQYYLARGHVKHSVWDKVIFKKMASQIGLDRVKMMVTGSAPIGPDTLEFLRIVFACHVMEGYGQTETSAGATLTSYGDIAVGHVGGPMVCNHIRLQDVPEMKYLHTDTDHQGTPCLGRGEVCFKGPNVFTGYYGNPEKTQEAITEDGWLHSGDIGCWTAEGSLRIVDRKKNLYKLANGEYVAPEKVEVQAIMHPAVQQFFCFGDGKQEHNVGVAVLDLQIPGFAGIKWAAEQGFKEAQAFDKYGAAGQPPPTLEHRREAKAIADKLAADPAFVLKLAKSVVTMLKENPKILGYELPSNRERKELPCMHLETKEWVKFDESQNHMEEFHIDLLTDTFKTRRMPAAEHYRENLRTAYGGGVTFQSEGNKV